MIRSSMSKDEQVNNNNLLNNEKHFYIAGINFGLITTMSMIEILQGLGLVQAAATEKVLGGIDFFNKFLLVWSKYGGL